MKHNADTLKPDELCAELNKMADALGALAMFLHLPIPADTQAIKRLSEVEVRHLWLRNNLTRESLEMYLNVAQDKLIAQAFATDSVFPGLSEPSV